MKNKTLNKKKYKLADFEQNSIPHKNHNWNIIWSFQWQISDSSFCLQWVQSSVCVCVCVCSVQSHPGPPQHHQLAIHKNNHLDCLQTSTQMHHTLTHMKTYTTRVFTEVLLLK